MNLLDNMEKHKEYTIANTQGHIFECACEKGYSLEDFVTKYMESDFCNTEMDSSYSTFQNELDIPCMEAILKEFNSKGIKILFDNEKHYRYCAYYVGFVYRYLQLLSGCSSKELIKKIPFRKMVMDYYADHYEYTDIIKSICQREQLI